LPEPDLTARLADLTAAAGGLAHEIRNPLSTLLVNLDLLAESLQDADEDELPDNDLRRRCLNRVESLRGEAKRLQEILDDFLRFVGGGPISAKPTDLNTIVESVADFFAPQAQARTITTRTSLWHRPLVCLLDERQFRQAVLNLLINAQEAMPRGGEIILRTAPDGADAVRLDVIDTGVGIPAEELPHIFEVYYSAKPRGTGLGLPTAKRIIEDHHGELSVSSKPGAGTNFVIRLPLADAADVPAKG
jgi:signal transduction histidine kinase